MKDAIIQAVVDDTWKLLKLVVSVGAVLGFVVGVSIHLIF